MNRNRLLKLADLLDTVPVEHFDYSSWASGEAGSCLRLGAEACGTTGCALGWATAIPEFGLSLIKVDNREWAVTDGADYDKYSDDHCDISLDTAARLFALTSDEARELFIPGDGEGRLSPEQVAQKIRVFVENN